MKQHLKFNIATYFIISLSITTLIYLSCSAKVWARVIINEILPSPESGPDLIEIVYIPDSNPDQKFVDLSRYSLWDNTGEINLQTPDQLYQGELRVVSVGNRFNKGGDAIKLKKNSVVIDQFSYDDTELDTSWWRYSLQDADFREGNPSIGLPNPDAIITIPPTIPPTITPNTHLQSTITHTPQATPTIELYNTTPSPSQATLSQTPTTTIEVKPVQQNIQEKILPTISYLRNSLDEQKKKKKKLATQIFSQPFQTTLAYDISHPSSTNTTSVIIGGLCLLIASKLLYEN